MNTIKRLLEKILKKPLAREMTMYIIFGVLTTIVGFGSYAFFIRIGLEVFPANTLSHLLGILFAYVTNKIWVFQALDFSAKELFKEFFKFLSSRIASFVLETIFLVLLVDVFHYDPIWSKIATTVLVVILNYLLSKIIVFRKRDE